MARTVVIDLRDFAGQAAGDHPSGRDKVTVWAPEFRASTAGGWTTGPLPRTFYFNGGPVKIADVEPGQIVIQFHVRQLQGQDTFTVNVPSGTGEVRLSELMADVFEYDPPIISEAQRTLMSAREALTAATKLRDEAEGLRSSAKTDVGKSVDGAKQDLDKAVESAKTNLNKAVETATTSWGKQLETMQGSISSLMNSTRTTTDQILKDHKAQVAKSQQIQKDMQNVLDTISWSGDKLSVNGKQSPSLTGPRGQTGLTGPKGDPGASAWSDITGKPSKFPPEDHKHLREDITDLPDITYRTVNNALVQRYSNGQIGVPIEPTLEEYAASKKYVDTTAFPREVKLIKGSVDLNDYKESGLYYQAVAKDAASGKNYPSFYGGLLEVAGVDSDTVYQRYTDHGPMGISRTRRFASGSWSNWREVETTGHTHTWKDITGKPSKFPPESHTHTSAEISDTTNDAGSSEHGGKVLVPRAKDGKIFYYSDPTEYRELARKGYVDSVGNTKADKSHTHSSADISDAVEAYVLKADGNNANRLIRSDSRGRLTVQDANYSDTATAVVNKKYVDTTAFPLAIQDIPSYKDLDTYTTTGIYHQNTDANARSGTNYPPGAGAGLLEVFNPDGKMVYQRYTRYGNNNQVWTRGFYSKSWSPWKMSAQDGHKHTVSDISDLPKIDNNVSGGSLVQRYGNGAILVPDPPPTSTSATSKSYVDSRIQVVSSLPSSPQSDVLYVITE